MPTETRVDILLVDDNPSNLLALEAMLEDLGQNLVKATSGHEALKCLLDQDFALILMDIQMPGMDGFQTTAAIRAREEPTRRIPILATTANASREDRERCLAAGMDGYLAKPIRYEELIALIESTVLVEREPRPLPAPPSEGRGRKPDLHREMTPLFVEDAMRLHAEMREAITRRDGPTLQRAAHTLCGTAGFFKAQAVLDLARRLEKLGKAGDFSAETDCAAEELGEELARLERRLRGDGEPNA
jgi:two-component system sensor histidine kinase/response regulator